MSHTFRAGPRNRLLPGRVTVYFVLASCLCCGEAYDDVLRRMVRGLKFPGMRVMAVDGMVFDVPDTADNAAVFAKGSNDAGAGPFPQVRLVGLAECGTHAIVAAAFDPRTVDELTLFGQLIDDLEAGMTVLCDPTGPTCRARPADRREQLPTRKDSTHT